VEDSLLKYNRNWFSIARISALFVCCIAEILSAVFQFAFVRRLLPRRSTRGLGLGLRRSPRQRQQHGS
jgi:hypothetical protein